jgi:hypothetical protein
MIVRISGEGQYELADQDHARLAELDAAIISATEKADEQAFADAYGTLIAYVREHGRQLADEELEGSDVILPPADLTLAEAGVQFTGEGLIPD